MNTNFALALSSTSIFAFLVGCSVTVEPIGGGTSGFPTGTSSSGGDGAGGASSSSGGDGAGGASTPTSTTGVGGTGGAGPAASCDPTAVPGQSACNVTPIADVVNQATAQTALVGHWYTCSSTTSMLEPRGGAGIAFLPNGKFKLLKTDNAQLVCMSGFDVEGNWSLMDNSGIGLPDEYNLYLDWDGGGLSPAHLDFANGMSYLRINNGAGGHDDLILVP